MTIDHPMFFWRTSLVLLVDSDARLYTAHARTIELVGKTIQLRTTKGNR